MAGGEGGEGAGISSIIVGITDVFFGIISFKFGWPGLFGRTCGASGPLPG